MFINFFINKLLIYLQNKTITMTKQEHKIANFIIEQKLFLKRMNMPEDLFDGLFKENFKKQLNK